MTDMCGPKSGVWKMTLTVTLGDMKRDPYSDLTVKFETLTLTFRCSFLMGTTENFSELRLLKAKNATDYEI